MKNEDNKKLAGDESTHINLRVIGNAEEEVLFRIKRNTQLKKLMNAYCNRKSVDLDSIMFLFNGYHFQAEQTPFDLDMKDNDEIDALSDGSHNFNHNMVHDWAGKDNQAECYTTHLIDGDGTFNAVGLDNFIKKVKLGECGISYVIVAIMGPQSSGKSTLLIHLFHTNFREMDACRGRSQTTKGIWIAKGAGIEPCTIVMDLEGTNGRERGEEDTAFEKQSALFALAVSDIVLINMWCHDIGLEHAANKPLLKTVFQVMLRLFIPRKTSLVFVIRDKTRTPLENLESILREDIQKIWDSTPKPEGHKHTPVSRFFNVQVVAMSSYEEKEEQFKEQVASLRQKFFQSITPGGLAGDRHGVVPASGFSYSAQQIWKVIRENKDLDLLAHKVKVATTICEEIAREKYSSFVANKDWLELQEVVQSQFLPGFGEKISSLLYNCLSSYDEEAIYFEDNVRCAKRKQLEEKLMQLVQPACQLMLEKIQHKTLENFKKALNDALNGGIGFALAARDCAKEFTRLFDEEYVIKHQFGDLENGRDKFSCDLNSHIAEIRTAKLCELSSLYESRIKEALYGPVEALLKGGNDDTWPAIRNLLHKETAKAASEFSFALSGFEIGEQEKEVIVSNLKSYSRGLVEGKAREEAGKVLYYMKERFRCIFKHDDYLMPRVWTGKEDIQAITKTAQSSSLNLLSMLAVIRLDEETDTIRGTLALALMDPKKSNGKSTTLRDPLDSSTWEEVPATKTLITPVECKFLWNQFKKETEYIITEAIDCQILASSSASQARKRQRQTRASGSQLSQVPTTVKAYVPLHPHTWLHFPMTEQSYARLRLLCDQDILPLQGVDWELMEALDSRDRLRDIFTKQWRRLLDPQRVVYRELTLEFICSFQFSIPVEDFNHPEVIRFQLGGRVHRMSVADFGIALGLYTEAEIRTPQFTYGMTRKDVSDLQLSAWWRHVAGGVLGRATRGRWFRDPLHRYVHKVLAHTVASRRNSTEQVTLTDAFIMYCLLNQIPCNIAHLLASYFAKGRKARNPLGGGTFVTAIAEHLRVIPQDVRDTLTVEAPSGRVDRQTVKQMGLVVELPDKRIRWIETTPTPEEGDLEYEHAGSTPTTPSAFTWAPPPPSSAPPFLINVDPITRYLVEGVRWCIVALQELATHAHLQLRPPPVMLSQQPTPTQQKHDQQEDKEDLD